MPKAISKALTQRPKKRMGRKPEITEEQIRQMEALLGNHTSIKSACVLVGIPQGTYHKWIQRADLEDPNPAYVQFRERLGKARELGKVNAIKSIADAGKQDWRATAWLLERTHPDEFGPKERIDHRHSGAIQHSHEAIVFHVPLAISQPRIPPVRIDARKDIEPPPAP